SPAAQAWPASGMGMDPRAKEGPLGPGGIFSPPGAPRSARPGNGPGDEADPVVVHRPRRRHSSNGPTSRAAMNLSSKLALRKHLKQGQQRLQEGPRPGSRQGGPLSLPRWAWLALGLLLAGGGTLAVFEFFIWNKLPPGLAGKWVVQGGPMSGGTFEF